MLFIDDSAGTRRMALSSNRAAQRFRHLATSPEAMAIFFFERIKQQSRYWKLLHWPGKFARRVERKRGGKQLEKSESTTQTTRRVELLVIILTTLANSRLHSTGAELRLPMPTSQPTNARTHRTPSIPSLLLVVPLSIEDTPSTLLSDIIASLI
jgi:hypothetical protein